MEDTAVVLMVTANGRDEAERLAEGLVTAHLAGCASVVPVIHSFFYWEDRLQRNHEALLLVKTSAGRSAEAQAWIQEQHSGELPEILEIGVSGGHAPYLSWLLGEVRGASREPSKETS